MNKRIANKVLKNPTKHHKTTVERACKRLGEDVLIIGVDMAADGTKDWTVKKTYNMDAATTARASSFHHRTGQAPTTPGVRTREEVLADFRKDFDQAEATGEPFIAATSMRYEDMPLADLRALAKSKGFTTTKKAEIVALLNGAAQ